MSKQQEKELWLQIDYEGNTGKYLAKRLPADFRNKTFNQVFNYLRKIELNYKDAEFVCRLSEIHQKMKQQRYVMSAKGWRPEDGRVYNISVKTKEGEHILRKKDLCKRISDYICPEEINLGDGETVEIDLLGVIVKSVSHID